MHNESLAHNGNLTGEAMGVTVSADHRAALAFAAGAGALAGVVLAKKFAIPAFLTAKAAKAGSVAKDATKAAAGAAKDEVTT